MTFLLNVQDTFLISGKGLVVAPDVPYAPPRKFANFSATVLLSLPSADPYEAQGEFSLVHFRPNGYKLILSFPNLTSDQVPVGTNIAAPEAVHAKLRGADT